MDTSEKIELATSENSKMDTSQEPELNTSEESKLSNCKMMMVPDTPENVTRNIVDLSLCECWCCTSCDKEYQELRKGGYSYELLIYHLRKMNYFMFYILHATLDDLVASLHYIVSYFMKHRKILWWPLTLRSGAFQIMYQIVSKYEADEEALKLLHLYPEMLSGNIHPHTAIKHGCNKTAFALHLWPRTEEQFFKEPGSLESLRDIGVHTNNFIYALEVGNRKFAHELASYYPSHHLEQKFGIGIMSYVHQDKKFDIETYRKRRIFCFAEKSCEKFLFFDVDAAAEFFEVPSYIISEHIKNSNGILCSENNVKYYLCKNGPKRYLDC